MDKRNIPGKMIFREGEESLFPLDFQYNTKDEIEKFLHDEIYLNFL